MPTMNLSSGDIFFDAFYARKSLIKSICLTGNQLHIINQVQNNQLLIYSIKPMMNFYDNLWEISSEEHYFDFSNHYFQLQRDFSDLPLVLREDDQKKIQPSMPNIHQQTCHHVDPRPLQETSGTNENLMPVLANQSLQATIPQQKTNKKKQIKPSPYHNFQKHLNTALKHIIDFRSPRGCSKITVLIAQRLWSIFFKSENSTKRILSFIFNEFNEYRIKPKDLKDFGFQDIYSSYSRSQVAEAKVLLTRMAIQQLNEDNIEDYLDTRRIKHPQEFKKYLCVFRKELEEGFLKKRFTNRSRKEQMEREFTENSE